MDVQTCRRVFTIGIFMLIYNFNRLVNSNLSKDQQLPTRTIKSLMTSLVHRGGSEPPTAGMG